MPRSSSSPPGLHPGPRVHAALVLVQVWFASFGVVAKLVLRELEPRGLVLVRVLLATLVLLGAWALRGRERVQPADLLRIAVYACFGVIINQLLFIEGLKRTTATNAVVLTTSIPVFTVAVALLLGRERATAGKLVGLVLALVGALTVTGGSRLQGGTTMLIGNVLILVNSLSYSVYLVISREVLGRYRPLTVIAFTFAFGVLGVLPFGWGPLVRGAPGLSGEAWLAIGYIVLFPSVGTYFLSTFALARAEASLVAIYNYLQPVLGASLAAAVLGERLSAGTAIGGVLIFVGIWLVGLDARRRARIGGRY